MSEKASPDEVGYGKPPVDTQFAKGQSGNPNGRPKHSQRSQTLEARIAAQLDELARTNQAGEKSFVSNREAIVWCLLQRALAGDWRALTILLRHPSFANGTPKQELIIKYHDEE
jgi:hypothetical protein